MTTTLCALTPFAAKAVAVFAGLGAGAIVCAIGCVLLMLRAKNQRAAIVREAEAEARSDREEWERRHARIEPDETDVASAI